MKQITICVKITGTVEVKVIYGFRMNVYVLDRYVQLVRQVYKKQFRVELPLPGTTYTHQKKERPLSFASTGIEMRLPSIRAHDAG